MGSLGEKMAELESRALEIFLSTLKTESTKENYLFWLNRYLEDSSKETYDDLVKDSPAQIQLDIENYVMGLRKIKCTRAAVKATVYALFHFFAMNRVILNEKIIKKLLPEQESKGGGEAYSTEDVRKIIQAVDQTKFKRHKNWYFRKPRARALVYILSSSGIRLGGLVDLKIHDIEPIEDCYKITVYSGTRFEYTTFVTPESRQSLEEYLETRNELSSEDSLFEMNYDAVRACLYRLVKKANISTVTVHELTDFDRMFIHRKVPRHRLDIPTVHGMRKRWNTIMKSNKEINPNLIELMLGHSLIKLDESYLKPTTERLFDEYKKGIVDLTVFKGTP